MNIVDDIVKTIWGYKTFQQCIPDQYRTDISILVGKYYSKHPDESVFDKMWNAYLDYQKKSDTNVKNNVDPLTYIKKHYND